MDAVTQPLPRASTGAAGLDQVLEGGVIRVCSLDPSGRSPVCWPEREGVDYVRG
jgi:hypothetical protein